MFIWNKLAAIEMPDNSPRAVVGVGHSNVPVEDAHAIDSLNLFVWTHRGRLASWRLFLRGSLSPLNRVLTGSFWGHATKGLIKVVVSSASTPLVCTVNAAGEAIVSEAMRTTMADPLTLLTELAVLADVAAACWLHRDAGKNEAILVTSRLSRPSEIVVHRLSRLSTNSKFGLSLLCSVDLGEDCSESLVSCHSSFAEKDATTVVGIGCKGRAVFFTVDGTSVSLITCATGQSSRFVVASAAIPLLNEHLRHAVVMGSSEGEVSFWSKDGLLLGSFKADAEGRPIRLLRCAYNSRFASSALGSSDIVVWEMESAALQVSLECTIPNCGESAVFDWLPLRNGSHVLAVGSGDSVRLMLESGSKGLQTFSVSWTDAATYSGLKAPCQQLAFVSDGTLVVATSQELVVFSKWLVEEPRETCSTFHKADELLRPLPLYHPKVLVEYMMGGQLVLVQTILKLVLEYLEAGKEDGLVPEPPLSMVLDHEASFGVKTAISTVSASDQLFASRTAAAAVDDDHPSSSSSSSSSSAPPSVFSPSDARKLSELLSRMTLPHVSRKSQLHLLAVIDTFRQILEVGPGLDPCGTRFFISLKIFQFLRKTNSPAEFAVSNWAWAMQSQAHDVLLAHAGLNLSFDDLRLLGVPLWLKNPDKLKQVAENLAKVQFMSKKDPFDCMLLYVALKRVTVLSKMFKVAKKDKVAEFLCNDFTQERWQTAALKNAYALLKQQQFNQAAGFFLVGGKIRDALGLLMKHEKDFMMAVIVARLWDGGFGNDNFRWLLEEHIVPLAEASRDVWLLSIARWLLGDFVGSFNALLHLEDKTAPYVLSANTSDFKPVVLYYTDHLLSATEMVKHKKMDTATLARLSRKTAYTTFNAGCVHHCLERLIGAEQLEEPTAITTAVASAPPAPVPVKKAPVADAGMMSLLMFDDGFGDMPTPAWMLPKPDESAAAAAAAAAQSQSAGNGSDGSLSGVSQEVSLAEKAAIRADLAVADDVMKVKVALMFLIGSGPRLDHMCLVEDDWESAEIFLTETAEFLAQKLKGSDSFLNRLLDRFKDYCELYHRCVIHFLLLDTPEDRVAFFLHYAWEITMVIARSLIALRPLASTQAAEIAGISREIRLCFEHFCAGLDENVEQLVDAKTRNKVALSVCVGVFFYGWTNDDYAAMFAMVYDKEETELTLKVQQQQLTARIKEDASERGGGDGGADDGSVMSEGRAAIVSYGLEIVRVLLLDVFVKKIMFMLLQGDDPEKLASRYKDSTLELSLADALRRYMGDMQERLRIQFDLLMPLLNNAADFIVGAKWVSVLHDLPLFKEDAAFGKVLEKLFSAASVTTVLETAGVVALVKRRLAASAAALSVPATPKLEFEPAVTLLHDNDILHHFCVGTGEKVSIVVATSRGQAEFPLDALGQSAKLFQQKFKGVSESTRSSPERLKLTTAQPVAPSIPASAFLMNSDVASCVCPHPSLPFYLAAGVDGSVNLHQFGFPELLTPYRKASAPRVHSIKFALSGSRFGAVDDAGNLSLWQFESNSDSQKPFSVIPCHAKRGNDLCFLDAGNLVATGGLSKKGSALAANVAVWDTLIPSGKACVASFNCHPKGAFTLAYSEVHRLLISGGKTGDMCVWDMRMQKLLHSFPEAHTHNIRSMALDETQSVLATGSSDGSIKIWTLPTMVETAVFADAHRQQSFTKNQSKFLTSAISTFGVMCVSFWNNQLLSSGADGRLASRNFKML